MQVGINAVTGFDFYMAKNFFFGYELNFGVKYINYKDVEVTTSGTTNTSSNAETKERNLSVGPNLMNGIRIGYIF